MTAKIVRISNDHAYHTSRDYERLYDLGKETGVVCFVDTVFREGDVCRDIAATQYHDGVMQISCRGTSYIYAFDRETFLRHCAKYNVEFIEPTIQRL